MCFSSYRCKVPCRHRFLSGALVNLVLRVSLLCLPWSEERPLVGRKTLGRKKDPGPPRIWVAKNLLGGRGGRVLCLVDVTNFVGFKSSSSR